MLPKIMEIREHLETVKRFYNGMEHENQELKHENQELKKTIEKLIAEKMELYRVIENQHKMLHPQANIFDVENSLPLFTSTPVNSPSFDANYKDDRPFSPPGNSWNSANDDHFTWREPSTPNSSMHHQCQHSEMLDTTTTINGNGKTSEEEGTENAHFPSWTNPVPFAPIYQQLHMMMPPYGSNSKH